MIKIDIFSGFLGAGKTTLIKKLIEEAYKGEKIVLIENEFGEIGIDGGFLKEAGVQINEMNSGCICCSLVGDFSQALKQVIDEYSPDRIIIEPSGVGKLSDVIKAVESVETDKAELNAFTTVVDAKKCAMYIKNFGEFFCDQVEHAGAIVLSHTANLSEEKLHACIHLLREHNADAPIVTTDWNSLDGHQILEATERKNTLSHHIHNLEEEDVCPECGHHHHHHDEECHCHEHHHHDEECHCHEHHDHDEECHCHEHHDHDEECHCHEHHDHDEECHCHEHHHHHHHADEVFTSFGRETAKKFSTQFIASALASLEDSDKYGMVLRAKGILAGDNGEWIHFDYVPGEPDIRKGSADITGRLCVIGSNINESAIAELFGV